MNRQLRNPYLYVLGVPLVSFIALILWGVDPDHISLTARVYFFGLLAYVGARYMGRAPFLAWEGNTSPEAIHIIGFAILFMATAMTQVYALLVLYYDRAPWLIATYWSSGLVLLAAVGITLVAYSIPRIPFPPLNGKGGISAAGSVFFALLSAVALMAPAIWKAFVALFVEIAPKAL